MTADNGSGARLEIAGYASVFNIEDHSGDIVRPGAFADSLAKRGAEGIRMLFQHEADEPVGVWDEVHEDARGLYVRGHILETTGRGAATAALIREGAVDGLSIGFRVLDEKLRADGKGRVLTRLDLWEISIVTFPMAEGARLEILPAPEAEDTQVEAFLDTVLA
ncbi:MAG: HK97 family phage prohead protease [Oceanicaulis sp.]|uniref:HK97 family phage prohead protease n=1 Tax=Glycocaulis sp. TaxID=1969725 RepID=UPI0025BFF687|nr:HK97 family phage prohead protease [Glycocaulis sp.]MCC5980349.1 HK97 family phage prohead protease [Oceanicaulis sp.]MCH8522231.1 HK97 family phage prohead protease [Glycocaulis sp.]